MLDNYKRAKKFTRIANLGNILLVGLVLFQVFGSITLRNIPFLILVVVFGIFIYILNIKSIAIQNAAIKDIEDKIREKKSEGN